MRFLAIVVDLCRVQNQQLLSVEIKKVKYSSALDRNELANVSCLFKSKRWTLRILCKHVSVKFEKSKVQIPFFTCKNFHGISIKETVSLDFIISFHSLD